MCVRDGEKWRGERREREDCVEWGRKEDTCTKDS